jgi:hypothetical protein
MKNTLLIIYIVVSSGSILLLDNSLRKAEGEVRAIAEIIQHQNSVIEVHGDVLGSHRSALKLHESAFKIILKSIRGLYT